MMAPLDATGRPKSVLLLGASSDIGRAIAERLASDGARRIVMAGRETSSIDEQSLPAEVERVLFDAADFDAHEDFFESVFTRHAPVDVVVLAFGVLRDPVAVDDDPRAAVEMAEVNYVGALSSMLLAARHLRQQGSGRLVVLSSVAGTSPRPNFVYGSTKAGLDFAARGLSQSLAGTDVGILVVRPGFVRTKMTSHLRPAPLAVTPERVAREVARALARNTEIVWVPPALRWVSWLIRLMPPSLRWRLGR